MTDAERERPRFLDRVCGAIVGGVLGSVVSTVLTLVISGRSLGEVGRWPILLGAACGALIGARYGFWIVLLFVPSC